MSADLEQKAIARLREASDMSLKFYKLPLVITTSGGKDSSVCVHLAERAGIPFEVMHNHTTADAPRDGLFYPTRPPPPRGQGYQVFCEYARI